MALTRSSDPLVWIDCEMTGLDPRTDKILSISCYITTSTLDLVDPQGYHATILTPASTLNTMSEWCQNQHTSTGLVSACLSPTHSIPATQASTELKSYIQNFIPEPRTALLAGNTVHMDKFFLMQEPWAQVVEYLHYRVLDVSAIKEGMRRWVGEDVGGDRVLEGVPIKKGLHVAKDDVLESIEEARYYMRLFQGLGREREQS